MNSFIAKSLMIATSLVALVACELPGTLTANQNVNLVDKKGKVVALQAGHTYNANIEKEDELLEIDIDVDGKGRTVKVRPAPGQQIPQEEGEMFITAAQSGQPVDMHGILNTEYNQGPEQYGQRTCYDRVPIRVCGTNQNGHYVCWTEWRQVQGYEDIRYYNLQTTRTGDIHMLNPGTSNVAAKFHGRSVTNASVITWQGHCRVYGGYPLN
jgi:hypothetical protein